MTSVKNTVDLWPHFRAEENRVKLNYNRFYNQITIYKIFKKIYNIIFIIINYFIKYIFYILYIKSISAEDLTIIFIKYIYIYIY